MVNRADRGDMKIDLLAKEVKNKACYTVELCLCQVFLSLLGIFHSFTWKFNRELHIITCKCFVTCSYSIFKIRVMVIQKVYKQRLMEFPIL